MIYQWLIRNEKRRRIARAKRLILATKIVARPVITVYRAAWRGPTS